MIFGDLDQSAQFSISPNGIHSGKRATLLFCTLNFCSFYKACSRNHSWEIWFKKSGSANLDFFFWFQKTGWPEKKYKSTFFQVGQKWFCKLKFCSGSRKEVEQKKNPSLKKHFSTLFPTQDKNQPKAEGWFLSKWVYNFWPPQNLAHLSHHIGGGQLPKNTHEIL